MAIEPHAGDLVTPKIRLTRPLGAGGMGSVWHAEHLALRTQVVVKFIAADLAKNKDAIARFEREAAAAAQVKSPHVVQILDYGVNETDTPFIVMELLEGHDLAAHIEKFGRLGVERTAEVVAQLCRALARAHESGIVHRDIKPQNIFLCDAGSGELFVKLLDFGIAKNTAVEKLDESTKTGTLVGSPYYMSPEQLVGSKIDFRTDLWSVGVVAFEAMTGTRAFEGETVGALAVRIHTDPLPLPSKRCDAATAAVDAWFSRACARTSTDRFGSAKEMADALVAAIGGDATKSRLSSSGSVLARSGDDPLALAKTAVDSAPVSASSGADPRVMTYSGVEASRASTQSRSRRGWYIGIAGAVFALGLVVTTRALRTEQKPEPAKTLQNTTSAALPSIPPPPSLESTTVAPITALPSSSAIKNVVLPTSTKIATHPIAPLATVAQPLPTQTARAGNEDDIK